MVPVPGPPSVETRTAINVPTATSATAATPHQAARRRSDGRAELPSPVKDGLEPTRVATGRRGVDSTGGVSAAVGAWRWALVVAAAPASLGNPGAAEVVDPAIG
jgi:hypothetical protein